MSTVLPRPFTTNSSVQQYLSYLSDVSSQMSRKRKLAAWDMDEHVNHETRKKSMITLTETTQFRKNLNRELVKLRREISDPKDMRQVKLLHTPGLSSLTDEKIAECDRILREIRNIYESATVSHWKGSNKVSLTYVERVMAESDNPNEMLYYWLEWPKVTGRRVKTLFERYVDIVNQSAFLDGFTDAGEMWAAPYETEDFMKLLASEMDEVIPLYEQLHAYVRRCLHKKYGNATGANENGLIPAHLTGDIFGRNWKQVYRIVAPYPKSKTLSDVNLEEQQYTVDRMTRDAERMFHSLGFDCLPPLFWTRSTFKRSNASDEDCTPTAWDLGGDDFRVKFCGEMTMEDFALVHKLVAQVEYFMAYRPQPFPFRAPANPGFMDAIGGAIVLSARSRKHLKTLGLDNDEQDAQSLEEDDINFLMEMALEKVASLPYVYSHDLWRSKVFQGEITSAEYTRSWWQLRERYQGVASPVHRTEEDFDVGANSRVVASEPFIKDFASNIMEFQFHESLCSKAGHVGPLHACDISSSSTAGLVLRNVMSMGASEHWRAAMKRLTGQRKISARPLLRYFQPLNDWLQTKNRADQLHIGWEGK